MQSIAQCTGKDSCRKAGALAQAIPLEDVLDLRHFRRRGEWWDGPCPLPGHEDRHPSFSIHHVTKAWICRAGCSSGGLVALLAQLTGVEPRVIHRRLAVRYLNPLRSTGGGQR